MTVGVMQPYFIPYIGYYQLIQHVDLFIIYDNLKYTKKGWINRNRILSTSDNYQMLSIPLQKASDSLNINERYIASHHKSYMAKNLRKIHATYSKAPYFKNIFPIVQNLFKDDEKNLFLFLKNSILTINQILGIKTPIITSSSIPVNHTLKKTDKILTYCKYLGATTYTNPIGGVSLYDKEYFKANKIKLEFIKTKDISYKQKSDIFVENLSIIDILMYNPIDEINTMLKNYILI